MLYPGQPVSYEYLEHRERRSTEKGYPAPKWVLFCKTMYPYCDMVKVYESKTTVSKYITVVRGKIKIKVRFSDHKASYTKEISGDSDFYVGRTSKGIFNTRHAMDYVFEKLGLGIEL